MAGSGKGTPEKLDSKANQARGHRRTKKTLKPRQKGDTQAPRHRNQGQADEKNDPKIGLALKSETKKTLHGKTKKKKRRVSRKGNRHTGKSFQGKRGR